MSASESRESVRIVDGGTYEVRIASGLRHAFASHVAAAAAAHRYAVVTDAHVAEHYANALVEDLSAYGAVSLHVIPAGESHKTRDTWARVTDELLAAGCGRDTTIVALGGGVVGDLAGFVAATFMRGIPVVQCPTTLLAMIDASVGGKTGVDTLAGKNLVGSFHPPAVVLADVDMMRTLSLEHRRAGLAEAFKHGVIADARYFVQLDSACDAILGGDVPATLDAVVRSIEIKAAVVRADLREHGVRKTLNFGHTLGHAIEHASGWTLLHGECVAIGMVLETRLAERIGVAASGTARIIEDVLTGAGLPTVRPRTIDPEAVLAATRHDKKTRAGAVEYSLPSRIGEMAGVETAWSIAVDDEHVRAVLV